MRVGVPKRFASNVTPALEGIVTRVYPGARLLEVTPFPSDAAAAASESTLKVVRYGVPLLLRVREASGRERKLVFHTARPDVFGHDRRSDRAAELLLAHDTFDSIPGHVRPIDVGAIKNDGA